MKERVRTVSEKLDVKGKTINQIARWYFNDELFVNRRYQRKLVWSLDEKKLFIDSIINKFPTPSIMINDFHEKIGEKEYQRYEIIDGLQRLNAIFSFIAGEFGIEYDNEIKYFDISHIPSAGILRKSGRWEDHENLLPDDICADFADSELPIILSGQDTVKIEEIFRRINSSGKKLSAQDLRQAGATGKFADFVRRVACRIRKDYTYEDSINLYDMPKISISNDGLGYGVNIHETFWRKHDIISCDNLRASKDEEIIETLVATIFLKDDFKKNKSNLDKLYENGTKLNNKIEDIIAGFDKFELEDKFVHVFDVIDMIFDSVKSDFSSYIFSKTREKGKDECFKVLFLAIYRLLDSSFQIENYKQVANNVKRASAIFKEFTTGEKINYDNIDIATENLHNLLKPVFSKKIKRDNTELQNEIDKRLSYSRLESQMTEFKIGISNFASDAINYKCISKIAKTLVAMANTPNEKYEIGYVIIGVANSKEDYDNWNSVYQTPSLIVNQHYIPGIACEAKKMYGKTQTINADAYMRELRKAISKEPINKKLKDYILGNYELFDYHNTEIIVLRSKNVGEISTYDGVKYVRCGNETIKI
jgi:Protein of unknown function DUF262.